MKYDQGLFEKAGKMDPEKTASTSTAKRSKASRRKWPRRPSWWCATTRSSCPSPRTRRILVIEQIMPYSFLGKDLYSHPHMFCEQMAKHSMNLILDDTGFYGSDEDIEEALKLAKLADLVVMTNYYARIEKKGNNQRLVKALKAAGTP
jgi:hypothetical protein